MQSRVIAAFSIVLAGISSGLYAKKKTPPAAVPALSQMTPDQKVIHALNRLTFGAREEDLDAIRRIGLNQWIEQQLHPQAIPEDPRLIAKLAPFVSLRMSSAELVQHYPTPQMVKAMVDGKQPFPTDIETRYAVEKLVARFERKDAADKAGQTENQDLNSKTIPETWRLDDQQKQILQNGKPPDQTALIESCPAPEQHNVLDSLPDNARRKLYPLATPELRRKIQILGGSIEVVNQDVMEGKMLRAIYSNRQLEEGLIGFWYNHFNVFIS